MFFITKRKMNKIIHQYEEEKKELVRQLNDINDEKTELKLRYDCLKSDKVNTETVLKQNNKLIDWIEKILKEFGTMEVQKENQVRIPIMINERSSCLYDYSYKEDYIIIPQIEIIKRTYERKNPYDGERYYNNIPDNDINNRNFLDR